MWWNEYWPFPWMFAPLMMMLMFIACMAMMFFMMRSHRRSGPDADDALATDQNQILSLFGVFCIMSTRRRHIFSNALITRSISASLGSGTFRLSSR